MRPPTQPPHLQEGRSAIVAARLDEDLPLSRRRTIADDAAEPIAAIRGLTGLLATLLYGVAPLGERGR